MGFVMEYSPENDLLRITLDGQLTDVMAATCYAAMSEFMSSHRCRCIVDFSGVTKFELSSHAIRDVATTSPKFPTTCVRVFVATTDVVYGMARMFQMLGEETRPNLHVVRTLDQAYHLLRVESPEFHPVSCPTDKTGC
ncbi:MAG: hypothetical protein WCF68_06345 [Terriglobales bacterium]